MSRFQVDSEAVAAATTSVQAAAGRIQGEVGALHAQLVDLQTTWTGQAAATFQGVVTDWTATQRRVEESLALLTAALAQAGRQYAEIEAQNQRLFAG
jgi:6 kDa early secretory antigenic target